MNKSNIQNNFSKAADQYNKNSLIQHRVANRIVDFYLEQIPDRNLGKLLDIGCGTGYISQIIELKKNQLQFQSITNLDISRKMLINCPKLANSNQVQADMDFLPFRKCSFDTIISSFSLQWSPNLDQAIGNIYNCLKNDGLFIFAVPNSQSLQELILASKASGCNFSFNKLPKIEQIYQILIANKFKNDKIIELNEIINQKFKNPLQALQNIKKIGANYTKNNLKSISKFNLDKFSRFNYFEQKDFFNLTWSLSYFICFKK